VPAPPPRGIGIVVPVETAAQMAAAVRERLPRTDTLIMAAAVADFTPESVGHGKLKKESLGTSWSVNMTRTTDILADIVQVERPAGLKVVGFALETENLLERATAKLRAKGMDAVVANDPIADGTFGEGLHRVTLITADGASETIGPLDKRDLAAALLQRLMPLLRPGGSAA
jgi:phosphopantothenoylcysteine decarboxylase/phosphopantothenate--cysteine ligase